MRSFTTDRNDGSRTANVKAFQSSFAIRKGRGGLDDMNYDNSQHLRMMEQRHGLSLSMRNSLMMLCCSHRLLTQANMVLRLKSRLRGAAAMHGKLLDNSQLNTPEGFTYFKEFMRPRFVKGSHTPYMYRLPAFLNLGCQGHDLHSFTTKFKFLLIRLGHAWIGTFPEIPRRIDTAFKRPGIKHKNEK